MPRRVHSHILLPKRLPLAIRPLVEAEREGWAKVARAHGWYSSPFFVQVWLRADGTVADSVSTRELTRDYVLQQNARCPYCSGSGVGTYWVHSLDDTIDTECHCCHGTGWLRHEEVEDALSYCDDARQREYEEDREDDA